MGQGVGRTLMTAFARQLQGEAVLEPNADGGLTTRLVFPTPPISARRLIRGRKELWRPTRRSTGLHSFVQSLETLKNA